GSGLGKGVGDAISGGGGPMISGGSTIDSRSFMDGSGWTVSTGGSRATGGTSGGGGMGTGATGAPFAGATAMQASQAGMNPLLMLALCGGLVWAIARKKR
ncbi:hypothetical protein QWJ38_23920, partial [Pelomonas sp. PFR6]|nr:hypothetical protein [Pelomonas sp. PFR6]MDN3923335.1 hypothetical protein [Pelomonas sp. PFR6]